MDRRTTTRCLLLALTLTVTGCSAEGDDEPAVGAPSAAASASAESGPPGDYASTAELHAALNTDGLTCTELRDGSYPGVSSAQSCILNESEDVVLLVFASDAERTDYLTNREELSSAVVGDDWAVQTVLLESAQAVAEVLGGEVVTGPPSGG